jgi:hypothetical protein
LFCHISLNGLSLDIARQERYLTSRVTLRTEAIVSCSQAGRSNLVGALSLRIGTAEGVGGVSAGLGLGEGAGGLVVGLRVD